MADGYVDEIDDDTRPEERELSEDAQWKKIQKNTFTRWTNQHLKMSGLQISDLQTELSDGLKLVSLIEVLASHQFKQINKRPTFRTQKLENVTKVLKFLEESEQLRIVNIDSSDIVDSRLKLILGLIWTLILHFSISMPLWEGEEPIAKDAKGKGPSPKHRILSWVNSKMPDKPVKNLTTDWNNGIAIGALVDALAPGLCPDWTDWDPKNALKNAKEAMNLAEKWLDIAQLLTPEELIDPRIDEKAMMTYLSQFPRAKLKEGAPLRPKTNPARVRAYGPGLENTGNAVKTLARFVVDTFSAGSGKLDILVLNPRGNNEPCTVETKENQKQVFDCCYTPTMEGEYRVIIKYASKDITNSPYQVLVEGAAGDPKKVTAKGPGIEKTGNIMGKKTYFNVFVNDAGKGNIECKIKDPRGREEIVKPLITKQSEGDYLVEYTPILGGRHSVTVLFAGFSIPLSPFEVEVATDSGKRSGDQITPKTAGKNDAAPETPSNTSKDGISLKAGASAQEAAYVTGRGVQPKGLRVNEVTEFILHTEKAGNGQVKAKIVGPGGINENVRITQSNEVTHVCSYTPTKVGLYTITVEYGQGQVQKSPFKVEISDANTSKVVAFGPGLKSGIVNVPAPFTVETHGSPGELNFSVEGASEAKISCADTGNGSAAVNYLPTLAGEYAVHVLCNKEDIKGSPFMAKISDAPKIVPQLSKIKAFGPGLELNGVQANKETHFTVDVKGAGPSIDFKSWGWDSNGCEIPIKITSKPDGTYYCTYMTMFIGKIVVYISYGGFEIPNSPYKVNVSGGKDSSTVTAYGPGLESVTLGKPATFTIDTKAAGSDTAPISVDIITIDGKKVPFQSKDKDGKREVQYTPTGTVQTTYTINISYKNKPIKDSPYKVTVAGVGKAVSTGQAYASGRGIQSKGLRVNEEVEFLIHTEKTGVESTPNVKVIGPGGVQETVKVNKTSTFIFQCTYKPSKVGKYIVTAEFGGSNITSSPFKVDVGPIKTTQVKAYGPGLERATVNAIAPFTVETNGESSQLNFAINGPSEAKMECKDNGDGSVAITYVPTLVGEYAIHVLADNEDIPKSPFMVMASPEILPKVTTNMAKVFGPGVEPKGNLSGKITSFTVDLKALKEKKILEVSCIDQEGTKIPVQVVEKPGGISICSYTPIRPVKHTIYVTYGDQLLLQSPYKVEVGHGKAGNVIISGPGIEKASVGQQSVFTIDTTEVGSDTTAITIDLTTNKGQHIPFNSKIIRPGVCEVSYLPSDKENSEITITVNYGGEPVKGSPFKVPVTGGNKEASTGRVTVSGKGVLATGVRATELVVFKVHSEEPTSKDVLKTKIIGPEGVPVNIQTKKISNNLYECQYTASKEGTYSINVDMNNKPAERSPFKVEVAQFKQTKIKAFGPGLEGGVAGMNAPFIVNTNGSSSELGFKVEGPSEATITCKDNGDGTVGVEYLPLDKGEYVVHVLADKEEISHSPFVVDITSSQNKNCHPENVKAYGPGLQTPGVQPQKPTQFSIDCSQAGIERPLTVKCYDSDGLTLPINTSALIKKVSQCQYTPTKKGKHLISVLYDGVPIPNSPFTVNVSSGVFSSPITAYGPGLKEACVNIPTTFIIDSTKAETPKSDIQHSVTDDKGCIIPTKVKKINPGKEEVTYTVPNTTASVIVNVNHQGNPIQGSPFKVSMTEENKNISSPKVTVTGKGVMSNGVRSSESVAFKVHTNNPSPIDILKTTLVGPAGINVNVQTKKITNELYECEYVVPKEGVYSLSVDMNDKPAENSPFKVTVTHKKESIIKAYGPGLEGGLAGSPAPFIVNTNGSQSELGFKVEGPSEAVIKCKDNGDGTVRVDYLPLDKGEYVVHVLGDKEEISQSPFVVDVTASPNDDCHPEKVNAYGPGLQTLGVQPHKPVQFTIDCSQAGIERPLTVKCYDSGGLTLPINTSAPIKKVTQCQYTPTMKGNHLISVLYDGVPIPNSPFTVDVSSETPTTKVSAYGPGLKTAPVNTPTTFIIDSTKVRNPQNNIQHVITDDKRQTIPSITKEISPGKKEITYTVPETVSHVTVNITDQENHILGSPFKVPVILMSNDTKVYVTGKGVLPSGIQELECVSFKVHNYSPTPKDVLKANIISPNGDPLEVNTKKFNDNLYECYYSAPKTGNYVITVNMNDKPVEKSPFGVEVVPLSESKIKAYGPGLECGTAGSRVMFIVNTNKSPSQLGFKVEGPGEAPIKCKDNGDGTVDVEYLPKDKGEYVIHVLADERDISNSPFVVDIAPISDEKSHPEKVKAYGPGLEKEGVQPLKATQFTVDCVEAGLKKPFFITCYDSEGSKLPVDLTTISKGVSQAQYIPQNKGNHVLSVLYDGVNIAHSPFKVSVGSKETSSPVLAYGQGLQTFPVKVPTSFIIDSRKLIGPKGDIQCSILDDKRNSIATKLKEISPSKNEVTYTVPDSVESVIINVTHEGTPIKGSPFYVPVQSIKDDKITVTGRGIEPEGLRIGEEVSFSIQSPNVIKVDQINPKVVGPGGVLEKVTLSTLSPDKCQCTYTPSKIGPYSISAEVDGKSVQNSPFEIDVSGPSQTPVRAFGFGLEQGEVNKPAQFIVDTNGHTGNIEFKVNGPGEAKIVCGDIEKGQVKVQYSPEIPGEYRVRVLSNSEDIKDSPFIVPIYPANEKITDLTKVRAFGPGLESKGIISNAPTHFSVDTTDCESQPSILAKCYNHIGKVIPIKHEKISTGLESFEYIPKEKGNHIIQVTVNNAEIKNSPFKIEVDSSKDHNPNVNDLDHVLVYGKGLQSANVETDEPTVFYADFRNCESPPSSLPLLEVLDDKNKPITSHIKETNTSNLYEVSYQPSMSPLSSKFYPSVTVEGNHIPKSPFMIKSQTKDEIKESVGNIIGLNKNVKVNAPQRFKIKVEENLKSEPKVLITDSCGYETTPVQVKKLTNNSYEATYTPKEEKSITIEATVNNKPLYGMPAIVSVVTNPVDLSKVKVEGIAPIAQTGKPQSFDVITSDSYPLKPEIIDSVIISPSNVIIPIQKTPISNGVRVSYTPIEDGSHAVGCWIQDQPVDETPCLIKTVPKKDLVRMNNVSPSNALLSNVTKEPQLNSPCTFTIENKDQVNPEKIQVKVLSPTDHKIVPLKIQEVPHGLLCEFIPTKTGPHSMITSVDNIPLKDSPYIINVKDNQTMKTNNPGDNPVQPRVIALVNADKIHLEETVQSRTDKPFKALEEAMQELKDKTTRESKWPQSHSDEPSNKVVAYGKGLEKVCATDKATFTIDSKDAPSAPLGVTVEGPGEAEIKCIDNEDGTCGVEYEAPIPGLYTVNVLYDNTHIPKSPFVVVAYPKEKKDLNLAAITASGPGLNPKGVFKDSFARFTVDSSSVDLTGEGVVKALVECPSGKKTLGTVENLNDGTYNVRYSPTEEGAHKVHVLYENLPIMNSPFIVPSKPGFNAKLVTAKGPGLETCKVNKPTQFNVDLDGAGQGSLGLSIEGPADAEIDCLDNKDGTCSVTYTPTKAGEYDINVKFNDVDISESPFRVKVLDEVKPEKVKSEGPKSYCKQNIPNHFIVNASEAGNGSLKVTVEQPGQNVPTKYGCVNLIEDASPGLFDVFFVPEALGPCEVQVTYDDKPIKGSPFKTNVVKPAEVNKVSISGEGIVPVNGTILASMPAIFYVDAKDAGVSPDVNVGLFNPNGEPMPLRIESTPNGLYTCEYQTHDVGNHKINVDVDGQSLPKSPFTIMSIPTGDADKCVIKEGKVNTIQVNKESIITVETKEAGKGQITCTVKKIERQKTGQVERINIIESVKVSVEENLEGFSSVHYTPKDEGEYLVEVKFGGNTIPNGKFTQKALYDYEETIESVMKTRRASMKVASTAFHEINFGFSTNNLKAEQLKAFVVKPSGQMESVKIMPSKENEDKMNVVFQPTERGAHQLQIKSQDRPIPGSPYQFFVDTKGEGRVSAYGPGLSSGKTNEVAAFVIVTKDAGPGGLSLVVEGPSKTEIKCEDNHDGTFRVFYIPQVPGDYKIIIKFKDQEIAASPFIAKITGDSMKKNQVAIGNSSEIPLEISVTDITNLTAELITPSNKQFPCIIKKMENGSLGVSFTPKEVGEHIVNIYEEGTHIRGSPFKIGVKSEEVGDANKVKVYGKGLEEANSSEINEFTIDTKDSGYGSLNISIEGPSKAEIDCREKDDGTCNVKYIPTQPGEYVINVKYAGKDVRGSPFKVMVKGENISVEREVMEHTQEAARTTKIGGSCEINIKTNDYAMKDLKTFVHTPSGFTEPCDIEDGGNGNIKLKFVARECGMHYVTVLHKERHIPGSPFQFTVGNVETGGSHKVTASGPGLEKGRLDVANEFTIYTREAGAGNLSLAMEGPSKPKMEFQESQDKGSCAVKYFVTHPGDYELSVRFNDEHIANSPFRITVTDDSIQSMKSKIISSSLDSESIKETGGLVSFTVSTSGDESSKLEATVHTPLGKREPAIIQQIGENQFGIKFTPSESGVHLVNVENNKKTVKGSPFRIQVGDYKADPGMVVARGDGLSKAIVNEKAHFFVNTSNAGSGSLNVAIDGPSKVMLNCHETDEGFEFIYVATAPGSYKINITFGGNFHIVGSPFIALVEGTETVKQEKKGEQHSLVEIEAKEKRCVSKYTEKTNSYPEKVIVQGLGVKHATRNSVNSFFVDCSQAGYDILLIGVCGPIRPCEEIVVKHVGNNQFTVDYVVREPGVHVLMVKWGDKDVSGSPFIVHVD